jgi:benzodiazapine receptor
MTGTARSRLTPIVVAALCATATSAIGGSLTDIGPWYQQLHKPAWVPPNWAFGVIWTTIFALATVSAVQGWRRMADDKVQRRWLIGLFALNGFLNVLWSLLFFRLHRPDLALIEVAALWASIAALVLFQLRRSVIAAALLAPYLIWVSIAAVLNASIVQMNGPFG